MFRVVLVKPRNIKALFRYRWMANYLAVPMMVDRHTQGLRGEHLRICHVEQDLIIEDVAKLLDKLFRGDRRIGNDTEFSKKVVLVDERLLGELGRNPTLEEIAGELHMSVEETQTVKKMVDNARMLDKAVRPEDEEEKKEAEQAVKS